MKGEGKIIIPATTWKVAIIMPRDHGLADVHDYRDIELVAVEKLLFGAAQGVLLMAILGIGVDDEVMAQAS